MATRTMLIPLAAALAGRVSAYARDSLVRFEGGIGVIPVSAGVPPANADGSFPNVLTNIVSGVDPGGGPWTIASVKANVDADGRLTVRGRGLLLASGNSIATNANHRVFATLICEATAPFVQHCTALAGVPLEANGDFSIETP